LTEESSVGRVERGEGSTEGATSDILIRQLVQEAEKDGREVEKITLLFVTEGLWAVEIQERGGQEPVRFFQRVGNKE
jgi:hypothetical protein